MNENKYFQWKTKKLSDDAKRTNEYKKEIYEGENKKWKKVYKMQFLWWILNFQKK